MSDGRPDDNYPLTWPAGWPRARPGSATRARFGARANGATLAFGRDTLIRELERLHAARLMISSNVRRNRSGLLVDAPPDFGDPGVAVYFRIKDEPRALACDKWDRVADNLRALAMHVEAIRGQIRWGVGSVEQAFGGYRSLPAMEAPKQWFEVMRLPEDAPTEAVDKRRIELLEKCHPDRGGRVNDAVDVNVAYVQFRRSRGIEP